MENRLEKIIWERLCFFRRIYTRTAVVAWAALYAALSIYSLAVDELASTHVQQDLTLGNHIPRWSGWTWATIGVSLLLALGLEGAFQEIRNVKNSSDQALKSQRHDYEDQLRAEQSTHTAEKVAHEDTRKALEKERAQPVSRHHRDRMTHIARSLESRISGGMDCRYWVHDLRDIDAKNMIAAHFPHEAEVFNAWDSHVSHQDECTRKLYEKVHESINRTMSSLPWRPEAIAGAFDQYMQQWLRVAGSGVRQPDFTLIIEEGRGTWQAPGMGSQILNFTIFENIDAPEEVARCEADFNEWFKGVLTSNEFDELRNSLQSIHEMKWDTYEAALRIAQRDEIYGRCAICEHP